MSSKNKQNSKVHALTYHQLKNSHVKPITSMLHSTNYLNAAMRPVTLPLLKQVSFNPTTQKIFEQTYTPKTIQSPKVAASVCPAVVENQEYAKVINTISTQKKKIDMIIEKSQKFRQMMKFQMIE